MKNAFDGNKAPITNNCRLDMTEERLSEFEII